MPAAEVCPLAQVGLAEDHRAGRFELLDRHRIAFPNIYYTGNPDALGDRLDFDGEIPITIVYDARGKELWRHQGRIDREKTIAQLRELLKRK